MIDLNELPKEPRSALLHILSKMRQMSNGAKTVEELRKRGHPSYTELMIYSVAGIRAAQFISEKAIHDEVVKLLSLDDTLSLDKYGERLENCTSLIIALELDQHFLREEDVDLFDRAELSQDEKENIRQLMANARVLVDRSETLQEFQRRNVLYHISRIENELHRERSHFQTFLAAAYQMSSLVRQVGEDVQPIAEAIEKARTITEKKVQGHLRIEQEEKPKRLENLKDEQP